MALNENALAFMAGLNKQLPGLVSVASDIVVPKRFTTGSLSLDVALGGGLSGNQWTEIVGYQSMGKTAHIFKTIAANQAQDPELATFWLAAETYDADQAAALGVDNSRVEVVHTRMMELGLDTLLDATRSKAFGILVCDSYPALLPEEENEKNLNEYTVGLGARKFNQFWRKMGEASARSYDGSENPFIGLMVNQWREKVGFTLGDPKTTPGGHGKDFSYFTRLDLTRIGWKEEKRPLVEKPVRVGQTIKFRTIKNKGGAPQQTAEVDFYFREAPFSGFRRGDYDLGKDIATAAELLRVVRKGGGGYFYYGDDKWQGAPAFQAAIREDKDLQTALRKEVLEAAADPQRADRYSEAELAEATSKRRVSRRRAA